MKWAVDKIQLTPVGKQSFCKGTPVNFPSNNDEHKISKWLSRNSPVCLMKDLGKVVYFSQNKVIDDNILHGPVFIQEPSSVIFALDSEEKKVKLNCEVKGNPKPTIRWKLNGTIVDIGMDYRYSMVEGSLLINNPNKTQDAGTYQCIATNSFGTIVSREAKLQFACK
ncbi:hypothetical protein Chor_011347 [Crotalus horridus]